MDKKRAIIGALTIVMMIGLVGCGKKTETTDEGTSSNASKQTTSSPNINYNMTSGDVILTTQDKKDLMDAYEFAKTDGYIANNLIREYMGDDKVASFANVATTYVDIIYDVNAVTLENDIGNYRELMDKIISDNCIAGTDGENFADRWIQGVIDSGAVITSSFTTGKDYVYADDTEIYVRGILTLKVESAKDISKLYDLLPVDVEVGREYNFVYDIGFLSQDGNPGGDNGKIDYILALATF